MPRTPPAPGLVAVFALAALALVPGLVSAGCRSTPLLAYDPWPSGEATPSRPAAVDSPASARVVARMVLERDGEDTDLTLYVLLGRAREVRLVGVSDLGTTELDVAHSTAGPIVHTRAARLPDALLGSLALHLGAMLRPPGASAGPAAVGSPGTLVRLRDGAPALVSTSGSRRVLLRWGSDGVVSEVHVAEGCAVTGIVRIAAWDRSPRGAPELPRRGTIELPPWELRARIDVLRWEPTEVAPGAFGPDS